LSVAESIEVSAKTVNDAIGLALQRLSKKQDDVDIEILNEGSRGILGIGAEDARIRVTVRRPVVVERPQPAPVERPQPAAVAPVAAPRPAPRPAPAATAAVDASNGAPRPAPVPAAADTKVAPAAAIEDVAPEVVAMTKEVVEELLRLTGLKGQVTMRGLEPRGSRTPDDGTATCTADVIGDDLGILIGRRGENLTALQYMTNLIVNKRTDSNVRIVVDVEHYLVRRYDSLRGLALRMAERVKQSHSPITLEPMPPHERRIIHVTLADSPVVSTASIGEGEERRVVISPRK
jgi:spoIIIJ-associated protein